MNFIIKDTNKVLIMYNQMRIKLKIITSWSGRGGLWESPITLMMFFHTTMVLCVFRLHTIRYPLFWFFFSLAICALCSSFAFEFYISWFFSWKSSWMLLMKTSHWNVLSHCHYSSSDLPCTCIILKYLSWTVSSMNFLFKQ